ncbi:hypothetical protein [Salinigranum sp. GCM10025319]|uniref:hypothetical protein n=1 Tax=Salinigranum sp. GCM10025319 TaxID=3252687 RepID=UPI00360F2A50
MSFVRLCDVFGGDVLATATTSTAGCCFGDLGGFFSCGLTQCFSSVVVRFDILVGGFRKDGFYLFRVNCVSGLLSCFASWAVWVSYHCTSLAWSEYKENRVASL